MEYDPNIQEEVSKMSLLIGMLLFITDRCQSGPAGYSLFSSQVVSDILFYCTWNVRSAKPLVDCGALEKMLSITQKLLIDKDSAAPLRWGMCYRTVRDHINVKLLPFNGLGWEGITDSLWHHWLADSIGFCH